MVLPPPIPPTDPADRKNYDAGDSAMNALRVQAGFPAPDAARDTRIHAAMQTALAEAAATAAAKPKKKKSSRKQPPAARASFFRRVLPWVSIAAVLLIVVGIVAFQVQQELQRDELQTTTGIIALKTETPRPDYTLNPTADVPPPAPPGQPRFYLANDEQPPVPDAVVPMEHIEDNTHNETADDMDANTARGDQHAVGTVNLGGYGAVGVMGVGGGGTAGGRARHSPASPSTVPPGAQSAPSYEMPSVQTATGWVPRQNEANIQEENPSTISTVGDLAQQAEAEKLRTREQMAFALTTEVAEAHAATPTGPNANTAKPATTTTPPPATTPPAATATPPLKPASDPAVVPNKKQPDPVNTHIWQRAELVPNATRLTVGDGPNAELKLTGVQANVRVEGFRARVLLDLYFYNDRAQQLQGNFDLRLPDGAAPYYLAFGETTFKLDDGEKLRPDQPRLFTQKESLNISFDPKNILRDRGNSFVQPKEARMVPREKAALAYRETVYRRRVDPALLEWTGAGIFSAKVFPLMPQKLHRIVVGYDVDLARNGGNLQYAFSVPKNVPSLALDLRVERPAGATKTDAPVACTVTPDTDAFLAGNTACYRFDNPTVDAVVVDLATEPAHPADWTMHADGSDRPGRNGLLLIGGDTEIEGDSGRFFAAQCVPPLPAPAMGPGRPDAVIVLDTSLSMNPAKFNVWRKLVAALLEQNAPAVPNDKDGAAAAGIARFKVLFFDIHTHGWRADWLANTAANRAALYADLDTLTLEGASDIHTALAAAADAAHHGSAPGQTALYLLSDGAATWGDTQLTPPADAPVYAYLTGQAGNDRGLLQWLANQTHGAVFTVADETPATLAAAAQAYRFAPWQLQAATVEGGSDLMIAGNPDTLFPGQPITVVGRGLPTVGAPLQIAVRQDGGEVRTFTCPLAARYSSDLAVRAYGQIAVDRLERRLATDAIAAAGTAAGAGLEKFAQSYACHFRVTGQTCSLLMLESEADYQRFNIQPDKHAFDIQSTPVAKLAPTANATAAPVADAKSAFLAQLARLQTMPGMQFNPPAALLPAAQNLPATAFDITPETLAPGDLSRLHLPAPYVEALAGGAPAREMSRVERLRREQVEDRAGALIAYSNGVEQHPGDGVTLRDAAYACLELSYPAHAYHLLRRAALLRPFEADTYLTMAQCLSDAGKTDLAVLWYEVALAGQWDSRFGAYSQIARLEYLALLDRIAAGAAQTAMPEFTAARRADLHKQMPLQQADLAVIIQWNTDATDVDLHVIEPGGEECYYQHTSTRTGASITADVTQGYGPELYLAPRGVRGQYRINAHYFAKDRTRESVETSVYVTVIEGYGSARPAVRHHVVRLNEAKQDHPLDTVTFK